MSEANLYTFSYTEVAESLVKQQGIHEGLWGIYVEFGIGAGNIGATPEELRPAAIVPILKIGIQRFAEPNALTVDASIVNPAAESVGRGHAVKASPTEPARKTVTQERE